MCLLAEYHNYSIIRDVIFVCYCLAGIFKAISSVNENLYICGVMALSEEKVKALNIDCVINATLEWPPFQIPGLEVRSFNYSDVFFRFCWVSDTFSSSHDDILFVKQNWYR